MRVLMLCTGNAARSVMAAVALREYRPDLDVESAGTLAIDDMPISWRTRAALQHVGLPIPHHRSRQATAETLETADVVIAAAPEHVRWVQREHPHAASKTVTLKYLVDRLSVAGSLDGFDGAAHDVTDDEEIVDPGGGEVEVFVACAVEIDGLVRRLAELL